MLTSYGHCWNPSLANWPEGVVQGLQILFLQINVTAIVFIKLTSQIRSSTSLKSGSQRTFVQCGAPITRYSVFLPSCFNLPNGQSSQSIP